MMEHEFDKYELRPYLRFKNGQWYIANPKYCSVHRFFKGLEWCHQMNEKLRKVYENESNRTN